MDTNIDPLEIDKFEAMATRWWDRNGAFGALHGIGGPLRGAPGYGSMG